LLELREKRAEPFYKYVLGFYLELRQFHFRIAEHLDMESVKKFGEAEKKDLEGLMKRVAELETRVIEEDLDKLKLEAIVGDLYETYSVFVGTGRKNKGRFYGLWGRAEKAADKVVENIPQGDREPVKNLLKRIAIFYLLLEFHQFLIGYDGRTRELSVKNDTWKIASVDVQFVGMELSAVLEKAAAEMKRGKNEALRILKQYEVFTFLHGQDMPT